MHTAGALQLQTGKTHTFLFAITAVRLAALIIYLFVNIVRNTIIIEGDTNYSSGSLLKVLMMCRLLFKASASRSHWIKVTVCDSIVIVH